MQLTWPPPNRSFGFVDALGVMGMAGLLVARYVPVARLPFWRCWFRENTGWPCLGCGLTRVADRIAHGDVAGAFDANPLGAIAALLLVAAALSAALHLGFKVPIPRLRLSGREKRWGRVSVVVLVLLNYAFVVLNTRPWERT